MELNQTELELVATSLLSASFMAAQNAVTYGTGMQVELTDEAKLRAYELYLKVDAYNLQNRVA
jgi:hypothetical protein